jgi:predicted RNA-binding Zn ribbon-like protein
MMVTQVTGAIDALGPVDPASRAPGQLEKVRSFVNTLDLEAGRDALATPAALTGWLAAEYLLSEGARVATAADLARAIALREALRAVLATHVRHASGVRPGPESVAGLRELVTGLPIRLAVSDDGQVRSEAVASGVTGALAGLLLIAADAATSGTWVRLKVCGADDCRWAFYDRSPTRTGCWCSMALCGSRAKSRSYRSRAKRTAGPGSNDNGAPPLLT